MMPNPCRVFPLFLGLLLSLPASGAVVINEVFYHAPGDAEDLEWIELHNSGSEAVDLSGWAFTKGIKTKFPAGSRIDANSFIVLCRNRERFKQFYTIEPAGTFDQPLSNKGEKLVLVDAAGKEVDAVKYDDKAPWPRGADGYSASLERIQVGSAGDDPFNWAASPLSAEGIKPAGTPGKTNASRAANLPPIIENVRFSPEQPTPDQPITIEASVRDKDGLREVVALFRTAGGGAEAAEQSVAMSAADGGKFTASIPGQPEGKLVRVKIKATDKTGTERIYPGDSEPRPAVSAYVAAPGKAAKIPMAWVINTGGQEFKNTAQQRRGPGGRMDPAEQARFQSRFMIQNGIDLPGAWYELTAKREADTASLKKLQSVFSAKDSELRKLLDEVMESAEPEKTLQRIPEIVKTFLTRLADDAKPALTGEHLQVFSEWHKEKSAQAGAPFRGGPEMMLRRNINVEDAWFGITTRTDPVDEGYAKVRTVIRDFGSRRAALIEEIKKQQPEDRQALGEKIGELAGSFQDELGKTMSAAQKTAYEQWQADNAPLGRRAAPASAATPGTSPQGKSAFVYFDPVTRKLQVFDFIEFTPRGGGFKVRLQNDAPLNNMTTLNLLFEYNDRFVLAEHLAYEVYRRAGNAACQSDFVRLHIDGKPVGYHVLVEQPNRAFLRRNKLDDDGNLYKILWYESGVVGQHEKKTNPKSGHGDVVALVDKLNKTEGAEQWELIQKNFDVKQVATYFAVNMVLSHWDGYFNNYFTYHDTKTGKWTMYPWDQDKTWGFHDGLGEGQVFFDMPLTFGMAGAAPPGSKPGTRQRGFGPFGGGPMWWRPGGYFSSPLLANAEFRKVFLKRTRELLDQVYTDEVFKPVIDSVSERLRDEVRFRAELQGEDPDRALERFDRNITSLRNHISKRREFLLAQPELKELAK